MYTGSLKRGAALRDLVSAVRDNTDKLAEQALGKPLSALQTALNRAKESVSRQCTAATEEMVSNIRDGFQPLLNMTDGQYTRQHLTHTHSLVHRLNRSYSSGFSTMCLMWLLLPSA